MSSRSSKTEPSESSRSKSSTVGAGPEHSPSGEKRLPDFVEVGHVRKPHGVRGCLLVEPSTDVAERFAPKAKLMATDSSGRRFEVTVASCQAHNSGFIVRFVGVEDRDRAEQFRGARFEVPRSQVPKRDDDFFYFFELEGCVCRDRLEGDLGVVSEVVEDGGGLILRITSPHREVLVPFVRDYLVGVDREQGVIELDLPPGLIDICASKS